MTVDEDDDHDGDRGGDDDDDLTELAQTACALGLDHGCRSVARTIGN